MAVLVKMMGHEVQFAINGFAALKVARRFLPEVVLLDLCLPDSNGCEIAYQLRGEPELRNTKFVAMSALPESKYRQMALNAGCEEFYRKPLDPRVLVALLGDASASS